MGDIGSAKKAGCSGAHLLGSVRWNVLCRTLYTASQAEAYFASQCGRHGTNFTLST